MFVLLLLLASCFRVGFSYTQLEYGETFRMRMFSEFTHTIEFNPESGRDTKILWKLKDPPAVKDSRIRVVNNYFEMYKITQEDNGRYIMRNRDQRLLASRDLVVSERSIDLSRKTGESLEFSIDLEPDFCNIHFYPEDDDVMREYQIVRNGRLQTHYYNLDCEYFDVLEPCGIFNEYLQKSCGGQYMIKDRNGNTALSVTVAVEGSASDYGSKIAMGVGVSLASAIFCACCKRCCCGKSSKKDESEPETPDDEPAVHYQEYETEPTRPEREQLSPPSGSLYPAQPTYTPSLPLIHDPPPNGPPAYIESSGLAVQADAPTVPVPVPSDDEPRFELKGMNFASPQPLGSDSSTSDVYTSSKLNFL